MKGVHLWLVLWRAARSVEAEARRSVQNAGLGITDFAVLEALLHKGPLAVNELGRKVLLTSGSITTAVDRLESQDLVERVADEHDRRARIVRLTRKGDALIRVAFARHAADMENVLSVLTEREQSTLLALLRKLGLGVSHEESN